MKSGKLFPLAKIALPKYTGVLFRERLLRFLDTVQGRPITWIGAPAGFGKTVLAATYLGECKTPFLWYRLDERDADMEVFFHFIGLAARVAARKDQREFPFPPAEGVKSDPAFILRCFGSLYDSLRSPFLIVLDDYQRVPVESVFHESVAAGLDMLPDGVRVLILSRANPPARFARLKANGRLGVLRAEELRFTFEETEKMLRLKGLGSLPPGLIRQMHERTLGWAAGLGLMMEDAGKRGVELPEIADLGNQDIFDYFAAEVLGGKDRETQDFLMKSAFLPYMPDVWAEELTGVQRSREMLAGFHRDCFFTERDGGPNTVYQYHPLFREFLLSRAKDTFSCDELARIKRSSALLLEGVDRGEDAAEILIEARDWDCLARLIAKCGRRLASRGRIVTIRKWLSAIPEKIVEREPWLLYWLAVSVMASSPAESRRYFEQAFRLFNDQEDDEGALAAWAGAVDTFFYEYVDFKPLDAWIDWIDNRISRNPTFPSLEIEAAVTASLACALVWRRPTHQEMKKWIARALPLPPSNGDGERSLKAHVDAPNCGLIYNESTRTPGFLPGSPLALITADVIEAHYHALSRDRYEQVVHAISEGLAMADKAGMHGADPWLIVQGAYCVLNAGDTCLIGQYVSRMEQVLEKSRSVEYMLYCNLACLNDLIAGNAPDAFALAEEAVKAAREAGIPVGEALGRMLIAQAACEMGDHTIASDQINEAEDFFLSIGSSILEFSCKLIKAYFAFRSGQEKDALEFLQVALRLGCQKGYTTAPYLWRRPVWSLLCSNALKAGIEVDYVNDLVRKQRLVPEGTAVQLEDWPWPVRISVLGKFDLLVDGKPVRFSKKSQKKPLLMLKMLIVLGGSEIKEEQLSDLLWPEAEGDRAHSAFTTTLSRLRRLIGFDKAIEVHDGKVSLNSSYCWVDIRAFEKIFSEADPMLEGIGPKAKEQNRNHETILRLGDRAVGMYGGPLLPGEADESWVMPLRERLNSKFLRLVKRYGRYLETMEQWEKAANCYRAALEMKEMIDEELYQRFMICRQHLDHPARAVEVYRYSGTPAATQGRRPASKTETIYKNLILST